MRERGRPAATRVPFLGMLLALSCASPSPPPASPPAARAAPSQVRDRAEDWRDAIVYFVLIDRFADGDPANDSAVDRSAPGAFHGGDLKGLTDHLDEIADLGVTAVWINPIVRNIPGFVTGAGFPDWGYHGYWADDFLQIDPRFGTEAELKGFVDACHRRGIRVLLDVVYNHAGYNSRYLTDPKTKSWMRSSEGGTCGTDDITSCVAGLPDFKTELPEVDEFLLGAQLGWAKRSGVDGFRLDTVKHVDHPFWKEHRRRSRAELGQRFFLLGEVWGGDREVLDPWFAGDEMDAGFDFSFQGSTVGWLLGRGRTVAYDRYLQSREKTRPGYQLAHFLSSHDVPGALSLLQGDVSLFRLAAVLQHTTVGIPVIYYGEEVARPIGDWPANRSDMPWGERKILPGQGKPRDEALRADYRKLVAIRRAHPALSRGSQLPISSEGDLLVFLRRDERSSDAVVVAVNRGSAAATARFDSPSEWEEGAPRDLWGNARVSREGAALQVELAPRSAAILAVPRREGGAVAAKTVSRPEILPREEASGMAEVKFQSVAKRFGDVSVIEGLDLDIYDHEFMVLVGPSGSGKSTALRMIAGLEEISDGTISIGNRVVNDLPPKDRDIAMVFQNYALYPHMTVRENLEFGLKIRKMPPADVERLVKETAEVLEISHLLDRKPKQLSGGQRQRVAVGRAIVRKPAVFLFDEPLSNLDAKLRVQMRAEIKKLQHKLKTTTVYVTHDQIEAMTMGSRIAVMKDGTIQQVGSPLEIYDRPENLFVANFIGTPPMNLFPATLRDGGTTLATASYSLPVPAALRAATSDADGRRVIVGIRPENLLGDSTKPARGETARLPVEVEVIEPLGDEAIVHGRAGEDLLVFKVEPHASPEPGTRIDVIVELDRIHLFDAETERRLTA